MSSQERLPTASSSQWQPLSAEMAQDQMSSRRPSSIQVQDGPAAAAAAAAAVTTSSSAYTASTASGLSLGPGSTFCIPWHQQQYPFSMHMAHPGGDLSATPMNFGFPSMMVHPSAMTQLSQPTLGTLVQPTMPTSTTPNHSPPNSSGRAQGANEFASLSLAVAVSTEDSSGDDEFDKPAPADSSTPITSPVQVAEGSDNTLNVVAREPNVASGDEKAPSLDVSAPPLGDNDEFGYTEEDLADLARMESEAQALFPPKRKDKAFSEATDLRSQLQCRIGNAHGFRISNQGGSSFTCACANESISVAKKREKRQKNNPLAVKRQVTKMGHRGCKWKVSYSRVNPKNPKDKRIYVTKAEYRHTHGCRPNTQQLLHQNISGGAYLRDKNVNAEIVDRLLNTFRYSDYVNARAIRNVLRDLLPESVPINAALIANVRVRMNKIVDQYERDEYGKLKLEKEMKVTADVSALIMRVSSLAHCSNFSYALFRTPIG